MDEYVGLVNGICVASLQNYLLDSFYRVKNNTLEVAKGTIASINGNFKMIQ